MPALHSTRSISRELARLGVDGVPSDPAKHEDQAVAEAARDAILAGLVDADQRQG